MNKEEANYDVVIIGSGMGGLSCANILSREGKKVLVLEKNLQIGGNLQVFNRDKCVFDTGVHYLGGLDEGQNLNQLFKYFGILSDLKLKRMDEDGFDHIHFFEEEISYKYGIGYENFISTLTTYFPDERIAIEKYCAAIISIIKHFPLLRLEPGNDDTIFEVDFTTNAREFINGLTRNERLQKVLGGTNTLYAGSEKTPLYIHALVVNSYIESSWRVVDGGLQIAKAMTRRIKELGGEIQNKSEVVSANYSPEGKLESVNLADGKIVKGKIFISNMHPKITIDIFGKEHFKKAYVDRINGLKNTGSAFILHIVFHENSFEYLNYNIYQINQTDIWNSSKNKKDTWPSSYMISFPANSKNEKYVNGISVICGMGINELEAWEHTFNNALHPKSRGENYELFKKEKSEKVIDALLIHFPDIRKKIKSYSSSTPLTQRDYTGSPNGSSYGIEKDSSDPFNSIINSKTSIPNLYLTGQNLNLHGILGVSIAALATCFNLVDKENLLQIIRETK